MTDKINELILTAGPSITEREISYCLDAVQNGWNWNHSDYLRKFENTFCDYIGMNHAMATSSCTGALHLALLALDIKEGDEVIVPELTWIATAAAVTYVGATPVFCDIDKETWSMCPESFEKCITPKTKAVIPVHLYGHPCDMDLILAIAKKHNLKVVEDAAQSIGSEYKGQKTGSFGDASCFSFQGAKALVTGEGGILLCKDDKIFEKARFKGDHGRDPHKALFNIEIGYKYKMSNLQAALGLAQVERVDEIINRKIQIFNWYRDRLQDIEELSLNVQKPWAKNIYWMTSIVLGDDIKLSRDEFLVELKRRNIDSRPLFHPISSFPMFETQNNPNAYFVGKRGINLPSGHNRTEEEVDYICCHIRDIIGRTKNTPAINGWLKYREDQRAEIERIKSEQPADNQITIKDDSKTIGHLTPITKDSINDQSHIALLAKWREENQEWFPSQFKVTLEGTKSWLESALINTPDRILYFVCDEEGNKIGHVGLYQFDYQKKCCDLDNILRGDKGLAKGIMQKACKALIDDSMTRYNIKDVYLRVFSDNERAVSMYEKLGFNEIQRIPLMKQKDGNTTSWITYLDSPYTKIERYYLTMKLGC